MSQPQPNTVREGYRAPRFTDTYNQLAGDIVARLERHWSLGRGERRESMLPDIAELEVGLGEGMGLDRTRKRRLRALVPRAWNVIGMELAGRLDAVELVLNQADPDLNEHGFYWIQQEGRRLTGEWGDVAAEQAQAEREALLERLTGASQSLDQIAHHIERIRWLALKARGTLLGHLVMRKVVKRVKRLHVRTAKLIDLHQEKTLKDSAATDGAQARA
ncbi:MAG: hypothetical protein AAF658_08920 [Myxococcota bacterium]